MSTRATKRNKILAALSADKSPLRTRGVALAVDHALDCTVSELLDGDELTDLILASLTEANVGRYVQRHVKPGWGRYLEAARASGDRPGDLVPDSARTRLEKIVGDSELPRAEWFRGAIDPALVRQLGAPVLQEILLSFARKLPLPGGAGPGAAGGAGRAVLSAASGFGAGLADRLKQQVEKRAEKLVDVGKTVLGGIGAEVEKQVATAARDFANGAMNEVRDAAKRQISSPEGREVIQKIRVQILRRALDTKLVELNADLERAPVDQILALAPSIVAHAARRPAVREAIRAEVLALLRAEGKRTVRDILEEAALLDVTRRALLDRTERIARSWFETDAFGEWLSDLLEA